MMITTVRSCSGGGVFLSGGCGASASSPCGVNGVMTMKMINSTRSTSINGVMLISDFGPPPGPPTDIDIENSSFLDSVNRLLLGCGLGRRSGGHGRACGYQFGNQPDLVHTSRAHVINHVFHQSVPRSLIAFHVDR